MRARLFSRFIMWMLRYVFVPETEL